MSGSLTYAQGHSPVGYVTPPFPSLTFNLNIVYTSNPYQTALLFYGWDIYRFTVYWFMIFHVGIHIIAAAVLCLMGRKTRRIWWIFLVYIASGAFFGFAEGSIVGVLFGSIYRAGALHVATWTPFSWALVSTFYMGITSYGVNSRLL